MSHKNHHKGFLGQISSGTLSPPQKIFSKFLREGTMPWMTTICSWAPCVPMACLVCWNRLVARAVSFQHAQVFLHNFFPYSSFRECHWKDTWSRTGCHDPQPGRQHFSSPSSTCDVSGNIFLFHRGIMRVHTIMSMKCSETLSQQALYNSKALLLILFVSIVLPHHVWCVAIHWLSRMRVLGWGDAVPHISHCSPSGQGP